MVWELEISDGLKIWKKSSENPSRPWVFFVQRLFITDSISILIMGFLFFYFENYFGFLVFMSQNRQIILSGKFLVSSGFIYFFKTLAYSCFCNTSLWFLLFLCVHCNFYLIIFDTIKFSIVCLQMQMVYRSFFKNQNFIPLIFCINFVYFSYNIISVLILDLIGCFHRSLIGS